MIVLWQTDQTQKLNFQIFFWGFLPATLDFLPENYSLMLEKMISKLKAQIFKKISESWVFAFGLFVRALSSEKKWPLQAFKVDLFCDYCDFWKNFMLSVTNVMLAFKLGAKLIAFAFEGL